MDLLNILMELVDDVDPDDLDKNAREAYRDLKIRQKLLNQLQKIQGLTKEETNELSPEAFLRHSIKALYYRSLLEEVNLVAIITEFEQGLIKEKLLDSPSSSSEPKED